MTDMFERTHGEVQRLRTALVRAEEQARMADSLRKDNSSLRAELDRVTAALQKLQDDLFTVSTYPASINQQPHARIFEYALVV
jgi:monomeric isocitrate dehydrogenase